MYVWYIGAIVWSFDWFRIDLTARIKAVKLKTFSNDDFYTNNKCKAVKNRWMTKTLSKET